MLSVLHVITGGFTPLSGSATKMMAVTDICIEQRVVGELLTMEEERSVKIHVYCDSTLK